MKHLLLIMSVGAMTGAAATAAQDRFTASADAVSIDVAVRGRSGPISQLTALDFELTDNGIVQKLSDVTAESGPIALDLLVDSSASVISRGSVRSQLTEAMRIARSRLVGGDKFSVNYFSDRAMADQPMSLDAPPNLLADGGTSLLDALAIATMKSPDPSRRRLLIVLTDGVDTSSVLGSALVKRLAVRTDGVVDAVAISPNRRAWTFVFNAMPGRIPSDYDAALGEIVAATGGRLFIPSAGASLAEMLSAAIDEFRTRYVIRYIPSNSDRGWHEIKVKVKGHGDYEVTAKRGYER